MLERENLGARTLGCRTIPALLGLFLAVSLAGDTSADRLLLPAMECCVDTGQQRVVCDSGLAH